MKPPILVIGTGRSGTSFIARMLEEQMDVDMGGPGWQHESNGWKGDYEYPYLKQLNVDRIQGRLDEYRWRDAIRRYGLYYADIGKPWGYKNPNSHRFIADWLEMFPTAPVIWGWRDLDDCARSCERWYSWPFKGARNEMGNRAADLSQALEIYPETWDFEYLGMHDPRDVLLVNMDRRWDDIEMVELLHLFLSRSESNGDE